MLENFWSFAHVMRLRTISEFRNPPATLPKSFGSLPKSFGSSPGAAQKFRQPAARFRFRFPKRDAFLKRKKHCLFQRFSLQNCIPFQEPETIFSGRLPTNFGRRPKKVSAGCRAAAAETFGTAAEPF